MSRTLVMSYAAGSVAQYPARYREAAIPNVTDVPSWIARVRPLPNLDLGWEVGPTPVAPGSALPVIAGR